MKHNKSFTSFLFAVLILLSFQSAAGLNDATWYVSVDVDQIENNEIYQFFEAKVKSSDSDDFVKIPDEISYISLYGNAKGAEDATAVIHGDFSQFSISEHLLELLYTHESDAADMIEESTVSYKNNEIKSLKVDEGHSGDTKEVYFSKVNSGLTVISFQLDEVKNWLDNNYDNHEINQGSLFSVVVDVQSALAHMGMNIDSNNHMMQSEIFQKVAQVSASASEVNSDMVLDVALSTNDEATAIQIEQIINGLVAMNNLSGANDKNELHATFMQNLSINRNGNDILMSTYASIEDIKRYEIGHLTNDDKQVKVEVKVDL